MKKQIMHVVTIMALLLVLCFTGSALAEDSQEKVESTDSLPEVSESTPTDQRVVVIYNDNSDVDDLNITKQDVSEGTSLTEDIDVFKTDTESDAQQLADELNNSSAVESAFVDQPLDVESLPNDSLLSEYYWGQYGSGAYEATGADQTWSGTSSNQVGVAVLDSGCYTSHPDLSGRVDSVVNMYSSDSYTTDLTGHGTMVCGVIAQNCNNSIGGAGFAGNYNVKVYPYRCGGTSSNKSLSLSSVIKALYQIKDNSNISVINMSFGLSKTSSNSVAINALHKAIQLNYNAGKVLVASAGNSGTSSYLYPASFDEVISVGAVTVTQNKSTHAISSVSHSGYSQYNDQVDVSAPGSCIPKTSVSNTFSNSQLSAQSANYDKTTAGTSFSAPVVSAEAAVLKAINPNLSASEITSIIEETAQDYGTSGKDNYYGYGVVQFDDAVAKVSKAVQKSLSLNVSASVNSGSTINVNDTVTFNLSADAQNCTQPYTYSAQVVYNGTTTALTVGSNNSLTWTPKSAGSYTLKFTVTEAGGTTSTKTLTYTVNSSASTTSVSSASVRYQTQIQNIGWESSWASNGAKSGTEGKGLRLEAIKIAVDSDYSGSIQYRTHVQNIGWQDWKSNGSLSGTVGRSLRLEAIQIKLTGELAEHYDVYYCVHAQNIGWMGWAKNGEKAGTSGYSYRLESIRIKLVPKGETDSEISSNSSAAYQYPLVTYQTHVQDIGWQGKRYDGAMSGTSGQSKRLEAIKISVSNEAYSGNITYRTHIQNIGWESSWKTNGTMSGTQGKSYRLEAIQIKLTGELAEQYDVYYRVHAQNIGWMGWAKNGEKAGTAGYSYRLEAINIVLVPKNGSAPGSTANCFIQK